MQPRKLTGLSCVPKLLGNPDGQQQSSYVSSGFVSNMLNPNQDTGVDAIFGQHAEATSLIDTLRPLKPYTPGCLNGDNGIHDDQANEEVHSESSCLNLARRQDPRESFDELTDTTFDFSAFVMNRLNVKTLTPELFSRSNLRKEERELHTLLRIRRGFIYENKDKKNRLMRIDELHKFSDGTLDDVRTALNDRLKEIRMEYLPQTFWSQRDKVWYSNPDVPARTEGSTQGYPLVSVEVLRFNTTAGNPVKKILLKLNLSDHRKLKEGGKACKDHNVQYKFKEQDSIPEINDHYIILTGECQRSRAKD
ncbi:hypothetical protein Tco_0298997 [Tanacetum coccineum]